jgi:small subunit ribosomal protein S2
MLVERKDYLTAGVHIGMKTCTPYMRQFVYKIREDGLAVFNIKKIDERIAIAAQWFSTFKNPVVISRKESASQPIQTFGKVLGLHVIVGRFVPGTFTNPVLKTFFEPDLVFVVDPLLDNQAIREAKVKRIPILALCDTFNSAEDVDFVIPANNNGKKSLALIFWLLAREISKKRGTIKKNSDFKPTLAEFGGE